MPEGDTIYRSAVRLRAAMEGNTILAAAARERQFSAASLVDRGVASVEARGKHLLMHCDGNLIIHSHMGMTGSWHLYSEAENWRKPRRHAALVLEFATLTAVCFYPKTLELLTSTQLRRHRHIMQLGPDLIAAELNCEAIIPRFRVHDATAVGEALLNQSIVSGIGNQYKSEVLFLSRLNPFRTVSTLTDGQLAAMTMQARDLMRANLTGHLRRTRFAADGNRLWVYGRRGEPCHVCGEPIRMRRQGDLGRSTYWCETCQSKA